MTFVHLIIPQMSKAHNSVNGGFDSEGGQQIYQDQEPDINQQPIKVWVLVQYHAY